MQEGKLKRVDEFKHLDSTVQMDGELGEVRKRI